MLCTLMWKVPGSHCLDAAISTYMEMGGCPVAWFDTVFVFTKEHLKRASKVIIQTAENINIIEAKCSQ